MNGSRLALWSIIGLVVLAGIFFVGYLPVVDIFQNLKINFMLFGFALIPYLLTLTIGIFLIVRYALYKAKINFSWGLAFLFYSFTFLVILLSSFFEAFGDLTRIDVFLIKRYPMVIFLTGMTYSISLIYSEKKTFANLVSLFVFWISTFWILIGLFYLKNIELTIFGFVYFIFLPVLLFLAYTLYNVAVRDGLVSVKLVSAGLYGICFTYGVGSFFRSCPLYYIFLSTIAFSLIAILVGLCMLVFEKEKYTKKK